jgi:hypothetical protein
MPRIHDTDDRAVAQLAHLRHDCLRREKYMAEVDRNRAVELLWCDLGKLVALVVGSVVDQHRGGAECRRARRADALRPRQMNWPVRAGFALQVEKRDLGTVFDEGADKGRANAAGSAGDDHRSTFE